MIASVTCPACGRIGNPRATVPSGTKVRCPCGHQFQMVPMGSGFIAGGPVAPTPGPSVTPPAPSLPDEPIHFGLLVALGWAISLLGGLGSLLYFGSRADKGFSFDDFCAVCATLMSSQMIAYLLWLLVDVARSLRKMAK